MLYSLLSYIQYMHYTLRHVHKPKNGIVTYFYEKNNTMFFDIMSRKIAANRARACFMLLKTPSSKQPVTRFAKTE